jgi:hypothetical protein
MLRSCYSGAIDSACCDEEIDKQLGCFLDQAEELYNTCQLSGDSYYKAIMLRAASWLEYKRFMDLYYSGMSAGIMGVSKAAGMKLLSADETFYGQMLKQLLDGNQNGRFSLGV